MRPLRDACRPASDLMPRMLGRNRRAGCGLGRCRRCRNGDETRQFKRREQREVSQEIEREVFPCAPRGQRIIEVTVTASNQDLPANQLPSACLGPHNRSHIVASPS